MSQQSLWSSLKQHFEKIDDPRAACHIRYQRVDRDVIAICDHITIRCNNREFRLTRDTCREVLLYLRSCTCSDCWPNVPSASKLRTNSDNSAKAD